MGFLQVSNRFTNLQTANRGLSLEQDRLSELIKSIRYVSIISSATTSSVAFRLYILLKQCIAQASELIIT